MGGGRGYNNISPFRKYDPIDNTWITGYSAEQFIRPDIRTSGFSVNDIPYIFDGLNLWKYDFSDEKFIIIGDILSIYDINAYLDGPVFFVLKNIPYSTLGQRNSGSFYTELRYDSNTSSIRSSQSEQLDIDNTFVDTDLFFTADNAGNLKIISLTGKIILQQTISYGKNSINVSHLEPGMYIVSVETNKKTHTGKIIKQ